MLVTKIIFWAFATATATALLTVKDVAAKFGISETDINEILSTSDVSTINVDNWADFLDVSLKDIKSWPKSDKVVALEDVKKNLKTYMESDAKIKKPYVAALTACGAAAATEEAISVGTLTPAAVVTLGACVSGAHATYVGGWTFCLGMKD